MATRGAKPKAPVLRLVSGTHRKARHGDPEKAREQAESAAQAFGPLICPAHLKGTAAKAWNQWISPAHWLDNSKAAAAIAFCELWKEFRENPRGFQASKHGQMRAYMSELGLTDERNRIKSEKQEKDEFFGD